MWKIWSIFSIGIILASCGAQIHSGSLAENLPKLYELREVYYRADTILIVYPGENTNFGKNYKKIVASLETGGARRKLLVLPVEKILASDLDKFPHYLIGSPSENPFIQELLSQMPVSLSPEGIFLKNKLVGDSSSTILIGTYPNVEHKNIPANMITGLNSEKVFEKFQELFAQNRRFFRIRWGYEVYHSKRRVILGNFSQLSGSLWDLDFTEHWDFTDTPELISQDEESKVYKVGKGVSTEGLGSLLALNKKHQEALTKFFENDQSLPTLSYHLFASCEYKGLRTGNINAVHTDGQENIYLVRDDLHREDEFYEDIYCWLNEWVNEETLPVFRLGISVLLTEKWHTLGYQAWTKKLVAAEVFPSVKEITSPTFDQLQSEPIIACGAATFIEFLIKKWGKAKFLDSFEHWHPSEKEVKNLEKEWRSFLLNYNQPSKVHPTIKAIPKSTFGDDEFLRGFNFAHEGYQIYNGYLSQKALESMTALKEIGTSAISIIPYTGMRDPKKASPFYVSNGAGSENDESVRCSMHYAKNLGMKVMLKPQIWVGGGSWVGEIEMETEEDWKDFFDYYTDWMAHYAIIAERYQADIFCVGVELSKTTLSHPQEWRNLIQRIRKIYSGKIVYAANWGEEFENLSFWDELDYIGIDCYYPLSNQVSPANKELRKNTEKVLDLIEKLSETYDMPVIFTEIGFRSITAPWKDPFSHDEDLPQNVEDQERIYKIMTESLMDEKWIKGIFWWKWPSYLRYGERNRDGYTPSGKPAEKVIASYFSYMNNLN